MRFCFSLFKTLFDLDTIFKIFCLVIVHRLKSMPFQFQLQFLLFNYVPVIGKQKEKKRKKVDMVSALAELVVYYHTIR